MRRCTCATCLALLLYLTSVGDTHLENAQVSLCDDPESPEGYSTVRRPVAASMCAGLVEMGASFQHSRDNEVQSVSTTLLDVL